MFRILLPGAVGDASDPLVESPSGSPQGGLEERESRPPQALDPREMSSDISRSPVLLRRVPTHREVPVTEGVFPPLRRSLHSSLSYMDVVESCHLDLHERRGEKMTRNI